jgi:hypothetical protein
MRDLDFTPFAEPFIGFDPFSAACTLRPAFPHIS